MRMRYSTCEQCKVRFFCLTPLSIGIFAESEETVDSNSAASGTVLSLSEHCRAFFGMKHYQELCREIGSTVAQKYINASFEIRFLVFKIRF